MMETLASDKDDNRLDVHGDNKHNKVGELMMLIIKKILMLTQ